jgi:hypothetical protein
MTIVAVRVTRRGVLVSRELIAALGNVQEVQIESRPDAVVITRKAARSDAWRVEILDKMKAAGLVEDLRWSQPVPISPETRAGVAAALSRGKPLSEIIMEDREEYA